MYAPVFTPFDDKGSVNTSVLDEYGKYLSERGVKGIYVADLAGEGPNLGEYEKKLLFRSWVPIAKKYKFRVVAQIGGGSEGELIVLQLILQAKYCECLKVDVISVLPTVYFRPKNIEQVIQLLEAVSKAAPSIPIQYNDYPKFSHVELDMPGLFTLATKRIPRFLGMSVDLATAVQISAVNKLQHPQALCIRDHNLIAAAVFMGYRCIITTIINVYSQRVAQVIKYAMESNSAMATTAQNNLNNITAQINKQGNILGAHKAAMEIYSSIKLGDPRIPIPSLSAEDRSKVKTIVDSMSMKDGQ